MQAGIVRIGTRGSPLALAQAEDVRRRLAAAHGLPLADLQIQVIRTSGDRIQDRPLSEAGGKGLFTKEIEDALLAGTIDLAVHSMKDVPTALPPGLEMAAILPREDVRDAFLSLKWPSLDALPQGARFGTSSLRRAAQIKRIRPDLEIVPFRGNVETRLKKLADGVADATLLAVAGLNRLGMADRITEALPVERLLPAVAQGAVGIEVRSNDTRTGHLVAAITDAATALCVAAERAFLARLEGSCRTPIGGLARLVGGQLSLAGEILSPDGRLHYAAARLSRPEQALSLGDQVAGELLDQAGPDIFKGLV